MYLEKSEFKNSEKIFQKFEIIVNCILIFVCFFVYIYFIQFFLQKIGNQHQMCSLINALNANEVYMFMNVNEKMLMLDVTLFDLLGYWKLNFLTLKIEIIQLAFIC